MATKTLSPQDLEQLLLAVRAGATAQTTLNTGVEALVGAPVVFSVAACAEDDRGRMRGWKLTTSHEPGTVFAPGVTEVSVEGQIGEVTVTGRFFVGVDVEQVPAREYSYTIAGQRVAPDAWIADLPGSVKRTSMDGFDLTAELTYLAREGEVALAEAVAGWEPAVRHYMRKMESKIRAAGVHSSEDDIAQEGREVLVTEMMKFASDRRPNTTPGRALRLALPNRFKDKLGRANGTVSGETAKIQRFIHARKARGITYTTAEELAADYAYNTAVNTLILKSAQTQTGRLLREDAEAIVDGWISDGWEVPAAKFGLEHFRIAMKPEVSFSSMDAPVGGGDDGDNRTLGDSLSLSEGGGYAGVEDRESIFALFKAKGLTALEAELIVARESLFDPDAKQVPWRKLAEQYNIVEAFKNGESANETLRQVWRSGEAKLRFDAAAFEDTIRAEAAAEAAQRQAVLSAQWQEVALRHPDTLLAPVPTQAALTRLVLDERLEEQMAPLKAAEKRAQARFDRAVHNAAQKVAKATEAEQPEETAEVAVEVGAETVAAQTPVEAAVSSAAADAVWGQASVDFLAREGDRALAKLRHPNGGGLLELPISIDNPGTPHRVPERKRAAADEKRIGLCARWERLPAPGDPALL